jgi:hypothetical protein
MIPLAAPAVHRRTELRSVTHHVAHHRVDRAVTERRGQLREHERSARAPAPAPSRQPSTPPPSMVVLQRPPDAARRRRADPGEREPAPSNRDASEQPMRPPALAERTVQPDVVIDDIAERVLRLMDRRARAQRERLGSI